MKLRTTGFALAILLAGLALAQPRPPTVGELPVVQADTVLLRNGDRLSGQVVDPTIGMESLVGMLAVPRELVRGAVQRDVTVLFFQNGDRITGTPTGPGVSLQTPVSATPLTVAWSLIGILAFPAVNTPPGQDQITLVNNDRLSGVIETEILNVQTRFGTLQIGVRQIRNATRAPDGQSFIFTLRDGDRITAELPEQTLRLQVAEGAALDLTVSGGNLLAIFPGGA